MKINLAIIGSGILDIVIAGQSMETKIVDSVYLTNNQDFVHMWNGRGQDGDMAPTGG